MLVIEVVVEAIEILLCRLQVGRWGLVWMSFTRLLNDADDELAPMVGEDLADPNVL